MDFKDHYKTLGVEPTAPAAVIKRAYRKLARKYHPDVSQQPGTEDRFKAVAEAHEALIDPERRAAHDALALRHANAQTRGRAFDGGAAWADGRTGADFSDLFGSMFGHAARAEAPRGPARGADQHAQIHISLEDAYRGTTRTVSLRGPSPGDPRAAPEPPRQLEVRVPKGVRPGQQLRLAGLGGPGRGSGPAGDLLLEVHFQPDPRFHVEGADVWLELPVSPWEAALGASVTAPTPEGDVQLAVPAGSPDGRKLRLKGKGLPSAVPGDLYAVLKIDWPRADTEAARAAYAALAQAFPAHDPRAALTA